MTQIPLLLESVSKNFAEKTAVDDVSFSVSQGEIVGFLGPNGAGKTTTIRMALGLIKPDQGRVELFGEAPGAHAFGRLAFLPEERGLYKKQTARATIAHMARLNGMKGRDAFQLADQLLDKYGLQEAKRVKNKDLSKGMAQKVQVLAAIAHDPEFYILDEPFSGLDPVNQQILENMVRDIAERGRTIVFSTHVMEHAERLCDRIILISESKIIFDGSTDDALARAPNRLVINSDDGRLQDTFTPFVKDAKLRSDGAWLLTLANGATSQGVLEKCVGDKIHLTRFTPKNPTLHEAFVAMVGHSRGFESLEDVA